MKKFLSILACFMIVLTGGIVLASCGATDEFKNATKVNLDEITSFVNNQNVKSDFEGYTMEMDIESIKYSATVVQAGEDIQLSIVLEAGGVQGQDAVGVYVKDNILYVDSGNGQKYYKNIDTISGTGSGIMESAMQLVEAAAGADGQSLLNGNFVDSILTDLAALGDSNYSIKKLEEGNTVKYLIEQNMSFQQINIAYSTKLVYENNSLTEATSKIDLNGLKTTTSFKTYIGEVSFPSFADYVEAV